MSNIQKINKTLQKQFGGRYSVRAERQHLSLEGESDNWQELVEAGRLAAKAFGGPGCLVNNVNYTGRAAAPTRLPALRDNSLEGQTPDVLVIGGGVVGCAIARELTRYQLDVLLIDKECDVALHTSSRNDGMVHPGLDLKKGSVKFAYNKRGNEMYDQLCDDLQVAFVREGQYLCFPKKIPPPVMWLLRWYWNCHMKIPGKYLNNRNMRKQLPHLNPKLGKAMFFPTAGQVCPYNLTIAYAENAIENGAAVSLNTAVTGMEVESDVITAVHTNRGTIKPKLVINAAGVFSEDIAAMARDRFFSIHPRRGTNSILDKKAGYISRYHSSTLLTGHSTQGKHTKGGGVIRTVHGNLLLGPNAVEVPDKEDFATTRPDIQVVFDKQAKTSEKLHFGQVITYFTGYRAATFEENFVLREGLYTRNIIHAAGIQSPGLTAAPAIGIDVAKWAAKHLNAAENKAFNPVREGIIEAAALSIQERNTLIQQNPDYGVILCRCEQISKGEILAALRRPLPCDSIDGVKRRVRAGMGRCQGGFCCPLITKIIADELNIPLNQVRKSGEGSEILTGAVKEGLA